MDKEMNDNDKDEKTAPAELLIWKEETCVPSYWHNLPYHIVLKVYAYLKDSDRLSMAQVCRSWYSCFYSPTLWRSREFDLEETKEKKLMDFVSNFGKCLTKVVIRCCDKKTDDSSSLIVETMDKLFNKLKESRLSHLQLSDMDVSNKTNEFKETLARCIKELMKSQTKLKHVVLLNLKLFGEHGTEVLNVLQESSGKTLESLQLINFFETSESFFEEDIDILKYRLDPTDVKKFQNLKEISVNYVYIDEEIVKLWTANQRLKLERITLHVLEYDLREQVHKITSTSWQNLAKAFPKIEVDLHIYDVSNKTELIEILTPGMPLSLLFILSKLEKETDLELPAILKHVCDKFYKKLVNFRLCLPDLNDSLLKEIMLSFKKFGYIAAKRKPDSSIIRVATVILYNSGESDVRKFQISNGINEDSPYSHLSQDEIQTLNEILCNIPNFKVEIVNEN